MVLTELNLRQMKKDASQKVLEKNGFSLEESFVEEGLESCYYQRAL